MQIVIALPAVDQIVVDHLKAAFFGLFAGGDNIIGAAGANHPSGHLDQVYRGQSAVELQDDNEGTRSVPPIPPPPRP